MADRLDCVYNCVSCGSRKRGIGCLKILVKLHLRHSPCGGGDTTQTSINLEFIETDELGGMNLRQGTKGLHLDPPNNLHSIHDGSSATTMYVLHVRERLFPRGPHHRCMHAEQLSSYSVRINRVKLARHVLSDYHKQHDQLIDTCVRFSRVWKWKHYYSMDVDLWNELDQGCLHPNPCIHSIQCLRLHLYHSSSF